MKKEGIIMTEEILHIKAKKRGEEENRQINQENPI
jgi:hypothetical protein